MQDIYNYMPETNHVCSARSVAAVLLLQFVRHAILVLMLNILYSYISTL